MVLRYQYLGPTSSTDFRTLKLLLKGQNMKTIKLSPDIIMNERSKLKIASAALTGFVLLIGSDIKAGVHSSGKLPKEIYDFVIVGAGNAGCVLANRLTENGKFTVCLLEAGRDEPRLQETLPEKSPANVPQPGDYHWGKYSRGGAATSFDLSSRGFGSWWFYQKSNNRPNGNTSTSYVHYSTWGGCTEHNVGSTIRNPPFNFNAWGLPEWYGGTAPDYTDSPLIKFYKKIENRSQSVFNGAFNLYNPHLQDGQFGGFNDTYYGFDGMIPLSYTPPDQFFDVLLSIMGDELKEYKYPSTLVDLDYPKTAEKGGLSASNFTLAVQINGATITKPGEAPAPGDFSHSVPFQEYNPYHDEGFVLPEEFQKLHLAGQDPTGNALFPVQRVSSANTYLYAAEGRNNLTIKSEVFVTKIIMRGEKAKGVEYYKNGYNVYQVGRNPDTTLGGYGGTVGDAKYNALLAKREGTCKVYAKKAVILCAGVYNTPQLLMLSGIGDKCELKEVGIKTKVHLPGVGKNLSDAQELFPFWEYSPTPTTPSSSAFNALSAFENPGDAQPTFNIFTFFHTVGVQNLETPDPFVQKNWVGLRQIPAINNLNARNIFSNILLDPTNVNANPAPIIPVAVGAPQPPVVIPPTSENGAWKVTFTVPAQMLPSGGYTVSGSLNPNYNGVFTCTNLLETNSSTPQTEITLAYPSDPGAFIPGPTPITITPPTAFKPIVVDPNNVMTMLIEQEENNRSKGYVKLQSNDPTVPPLIFFNYLGDPRDLVTWENVMMKTVFPMWEGLQKRGYFKNLLWPAPADILFDGTDPSLPFDRKNVDPAKLRTFLLNYVGGHHACGTCKMGLENDPMAVVDQKGAVFGAQNLYIADMSIAPETVWWPNGVAYVIGEKISDGIIKKYS